MTPTQPIAGSAFWTEQGRRFAVLRERELRDSRRLMGATYHPQGWDFEGTGAFVLSTAGKWHLEGSFTSNDEFKSIAALCAVALGAPNTDRAWAESLDCLRRDAFDFNPEQMRTDSWEREDRPDPDFEVLAKGLFRPPSEIRPNPDPHLIEVQLGGIDDVCAASERVCRRLSDEASKVAITEAAHRDPAPSVPRRGEMASDVDSITTLGDARSSVIPVDVRPHAKAGPTGGVLDSKTAPNAPDASRAMTVKEAARALRLSEDTLHRMRSRGEIKMFKAAKRWRVLASEVLRIREQR